MKIILLSDSANFQTPILFLSHPVFLDRTFFESPGIFGQTLISWYLQSCEETQLCIKFYGKSAGGGALSASS